MDDSRHTVLRRFTLGSGPLKRRYDRIHVLGRVLVALSFVLAPPLAVATTTATMAHLEAVAAAEAVTRTSTRAVLQEDAAPVEPAAAESGVRSVVARATWTAPDGAARTGSVVVPPGTPLGTAVPVWVDRQGELTTPPLDVAGIPRTSYTVGAVSLVALPVVSVLLHGLLSRALDALRERTWEREWAAVEPGWSSRRS